MTRRAFRALPILLIAAQSAIAHDVITTKLTYERDVKPILERRCITCHGKNATIPLTNFAEVRPWAVSIKEQVLSRKMPPWGAVKGFGDLWPDEDLNQEELTILAAWVVGGAPQGEPSKAVQISSPIENPLQAMPMTVLPVSNEIRLKRPLVLAGIRPGGRGIVRSARITAMAPDGRIQPLVWLFGYDATWKRTFWLRQPLGLPAGTVVRSTAPAIFSLLSPKSRTSRDLSRRQ